MGHTMNTKLLLITLPIISLFFLFTGCDRPDAIACTMDAKVCPDGSSVGRIPPDCEFTPCIGGRIGCDYDVPERKYVGKSVDECSLIRFTCEQGMEYFTDECGCGCILSDGESGKLQAHDCSPQEKAAEICTKEYMPVCGWFDPARIQCIKYPCATTYGNKCEACAADEVISWTEGECPQD